MMFLVYFAAVAAVPAPCPPVTLVTDARTPRAFGAKSPRFAQTAANFAGAYKRACAKGYLQKPLTASGRLVLSNAPEANVASIYPYHGRTLLEYRFVSGDGRAHVPPVNELEEAIFCAGHGASKKEQEAEGRCLPD